MNKTLIVLAIILISLVGFSLMNQDRSASTITVQETHTLMQSDTTHLLLDVRTPQEWSGSSGHLQGAILIPLQELEERIKELDPHQEKTIIAYCRSGNRSGTAARILKEHGFKVVNMLGGMMEWNADRLPVVRETGR